MENRDVCYFRYVTYTVPIIQAPLPTPSHPVLPQHSSSVLRFPKQGIKIFSNVSCFLLSDGSAGEIVNPAKTALQVQAEAQEGKVLYKVSHNDYNVGKSLELLKNNNYKL